MRVGVRVREDVRVIDGGGVPVLVDVRESDEVRVEDSVAGAVRDEENEREIVDAEDLLGILLGEAVLVNETQLLPPAEPLPHVCVPVCEALLLGVLLLEQGPPDAGSMQGGDAVAESEPDEVELKLVEGVPVCELQFASVTP